jgi:Kef-type K+ transport system membrane component KefB
MFDNKLFLIQIAAIIGFSWLVAVLFRRFGQPRVVGEMAAGIALGPTLFGWVAPGAYHSLFPVASLTFLNALSQVGLVIFIFLVGVRVDFAEMRRQSGMAVVISNISVLVPLMAGMALACYLFPLYGHGTQLSFALFLGTAMSVTAFPVLARILVERNLLGTRLGSIAIACAAVDDLTAWILLAIVVALTKHDTSARPVWLTLLYLIAYLGVMLLVGRALAAWARRFEQKSLPIDATLLFVVLALLSGAASEQLGLHALIGAFTAGLVIPRKCRQLLIDKLESLTILILIPLFFVLTGVRTNINFSAGPAAYRDFALILVVAIASKWGGTMIGACAKGMAWPEACQLGLMMNTRGLVELIVLNVGLDVGVLSPELFSMMVCMALVTTAMTTPLLDWVGVRSRTAATAAACD